MTADFIGENRPSRLTCGPDHLPGCYNPNSRDTYCICGAKRWRGDVGTWVSTPRRAAAPALPLLGVGIGAPGLKEPEAPFLGWDTYFLHSDGCTTRETPCTTGCEVPS